MNNTPETIDTTEGVTIVGAIDITPTWGTIGHMVYRFAVTKEVAAVTHMRRGIARAFAAAQALQDITKTLNDVQRDIVAKTLCAELTKQGF